MFTITNNNEEMLFTIEAEDSLVYFSGFQFSFHSYLRSTTNKSPEIYDLVQ